MSLLTFGLVLNTLGALLLVFFPPVTRRYTTEGAPIVEWAGSPTPAGRLRARLQRPLSVAGFALLAIGFGLQLYAEHHAEHASLAPRVYLQCHFSGADGKSRERTYMLGEGGQLTDDSGARWRVTINTPLRIVGEHPEEFAGRQRGTTEDLDLNRVTGSAIWSRSKPVVLANGVDSGLSDVEDLQTGRCMLRGSRAIE